MRKKTIGRVIAGVACGAALFMAVGVSMAQDTTITLQDATIRPEGIEYNPVSGNFLVGSVANGAVYEVAADGTTTLFAQDDDLTSSYGLQVDVAHNRLLVVDSAFGGRFGGGFGGGNGGPPQGVDPSQLPEGFPTPDATQMAQGGGQFPPQGVDPSQLPEGFPTPDATQMAQGGGFFGGQNGETPDFTIRLLAFDLTTKEKLMDVDLTDVAPAGARFANDVAVDADGVAYVTDSLAGAIYRVDMSGNVSYLSNDLFAGQGLGLNGIDYSNGSLIVGKSSDGALYKISLADPTNIVTVQLPQALTGVDGITFRSDGKLLAVSNREGKMYLLSSSDDWATATIDATSDVPQGSSAVVLKDSTAYVLTGGFRGRGQGQGQDGAAPTEPTAATIEQVTIGG